ncbi:hypothetical protein [Parvibaculum sp. MBR-TMA-1.3b-4.2]|jgi:hypothetical protein
MSDLPTHIVERPDGFELVDRQGNGVGWPLLPTRERAVEDLRDWHRHWRQLQISPLPGRPVRAHGRPALPESICGGTS